MNINEVKDLHELLLKAGVPSGDVENVIANLGFENLEDMIYITKESQLKDAGVATVKARAKLLDFARSMQKKGQSESEKLDLPVERSLLVPYDSSQTWSENIKRHGITEFTADTYIAGIKAMIIMNAGYYDAAERLKNLLNNYATKNAIPVPNFYYDLEAILDRREHGDIFSVLETSKDYQFTGVPIRARKEDINTLLQRINDIFVPSLRKAATEVEKWYKLLLETKSGEVMLNLSVPDSIKMKKNYPKVNAMKDAAMGLRVAINQTFAGTGIRNSLALYHEYEDLLKVLEQKELPKSLGLIKFDDVLDAIGFEVQNSITRTEQVVCQFVLSMVEKADTITVDDELQFYCEIYTLVEQIEWSALTGIPDDSVKTTKPTSSMPLETPAAMAAMLQQHNIQKTAKLETRGGSQTDLALLCHQDGTTVETGEEECDEYCDEEY